VRVVACGKTYIGAAVIDQVLHASSRLGSLTPRGREVFRRLKTHVRRVLSKLQVENSAQTIGQLL
jgi:DNA-binding CsgD family transcriptional regulator